MPRSISPLKQTLRCSFAVLMAAVGLQGCMTVPPEEDPVYLKQMEIDNRLVRVERVMDNQGLLNLQGKLAELQKDNQALRNEVETLRHDLEQANQRQKQQYLDLDQRLQGQPAGQPSGQASGQASGQPSGQPSGQAPGKAGDAAAGQPAAGADRAAYQAAFDHLKQGHYDQATAGFREFLAKYPGSGLADNAQYWLGESYYVSQKYKEALAEFETVVSRYPESRKLPDALLKVGFCHHELKHWPEARKTLTGVVQKFAGTSAARLASQRLEQMAGEGH